MEKSVDHRELQEIGEAMDADEGETASSRRYREVITTFVKHP
jgi:hypothetical protein